VGAHATPGSRACRLQVGQGDEHALLDGGVLDGGPPLPSDLPSELSRWFENMQRLLDLAQTAEQQRQLREMVERLLRENEGLREDINHLRSMVAHLTNDRAETVHVLRSLAAHVTAANDQVLRRSREGRSPE